MKGVTRREFLIQTPRLATAAWAMSGRAGAVAQPFAVAPTGKPDQVLHYSLGDIAGRAGLGKALNVYGGFNTKRFLLEEFGCGVAFFDYDNDGWLDIFLVNGARLEGPGAGQPPSNLLFHNNRDGTFTDVTKKAGLVRGGWGQGCCVGDYDNDGFDDLFITYWGELVLYHNNGNGTFTDVTRKAGLAFKDSGPRWNTGCCFVDYDKDGNLDLFVSNYVNFDPHSAPEPGDSLYCKYFGIPVACGPQGLGGGTNRLFHNRGDGTFEDVSELSGVTNPHGLVAPSYVRDQWIPVGAYGLTACAADFDNDGWPDIYVACDTVASRLYHNNHDGTFTEIATQAGCAFNEDGIPQGGMGVGVGDYDCDGWLDIVKTNYAGQTANLYRNNGDGSFYDAVFQAGMGQNTNYMGWGVGFADFDNDGWLDVFMSNGHVFPELNGHRVPVSYNQKKLVYRNLGNGRFDDVSSLAGPGISQLHCSRGTAFGDFDNDGDVDILVSNMNEPPSLLMNDCKSGNYWIKIKCEGTKSNRSGIGARVRVEANGHAQTSEVMSGSSYLSQNDFRQHFGLGKASQADKIEVLWPSGAIDSVTKIEANQVVFIREGQGMIRTSRFDKK